MLKRRVRRGFALAELVMILAMLVMLVTLLVAIALGATRKFTQSPAEPGLPVGRATPAAEPSSQDLTPAASLLEPAG